MPGSICSPDETGGDIINTRQRATPFIAAALATASLPASAQSNVSVYGIVDLVAGRFKGPVTGVNALDSATSSLVDGGLSTSRIGFIGSEALGDGTAAIFELSAFIRADTGEAGRSGAIGPPVNVAADPLFSRAAWVGLENQRLGRVRLGNVSTLMWINSISSNAFGDSTVFSPINLLTFIGGPLTGGTAWTNQITVDTPEVAGIVGSAAYAAGEGQGGQNMAARVRYAAQPLSASFAYQSVKKNPQTFADGTSPNNTKSWQLALAYDFKIVKLFAHAGRILNEGTEAVPLNVRYKLWDLSASVPVGRGSVLAGFGSRRTGDAVGPVPPTAPGGNREREFATVGYDYPLSKRTDVYLMAARDRSSTNTLPAPPRIATASATNFGIGMRHRF